MSFPNAWVMPGGHIEVGETLEQCAFREVLEETGIKLKDANIRPVYMFESGTGKAIGTNVLKNSHIILFFKIKIT